MPVDFVKPAAAYSRWLARLYRWNESLWPGADFGFRDPVIVRVPAAVGPELAASCVGAPLNYALRDPDLVRVHYIPDDGPVRPTYTATFSGLVETCRADDVGLLATLLVSRPEAHFDLEMLERAGALGHSGLCLVWEVLASRAGRTPWGATVIDVERAAGVAVGFTAHPHIPGCRVLRRLALDEELTEQDAIPPAPLIVPANWRADGSSNATPALIPSGAIATGKIAINAVSQHLDSGISGLIGLTGAFATIRSQNVTSLGGLLRVDGNCTLGCTSKDGTIGSLEYHLRNLTTGAVSPLARWQLGNAINDFYLSLDSNLQETPGPGTYTIVLEARFASGNFVGPFANQGRIRLSEFEK